MSLQDLFQDLGETFLTWCDDCGNDRDDVGRMRECPHCGDSMCQECYKKHIKWCLEEEEKWRLEEKD